MVCTRSSSKRTLETTDDNKSSKPTRRRAKTTRPTGKSSEVEQDAGSPRKRRRIAGSLSLIMAMPIEIFCEIASHSSPEVLLPMARASKALRSLLTSKSSALIWAAAERAIDIPPCPPDLSCPQYASLIFDKFCMNCLAIHAKDVNIYTRSRLCKKCEGTELISRPDTFPEGMTLGHLTALIPGSRLGELADTADWLCIESPTLYNYYRQHYYKPLVIRAVRDYDSLNKDEQLQKALLVERSHLLHQLWIHAKDLTSWIKGRKQQREKLNKNLRQDRREIITQRLHDLGYAEEDFNLRLDEDDWTWRSLIDQPRVLTDKAWSTIRPQLEETIRLRREKKSRVERETCLKQRKDSVRDLALSVMKYEEGKLYLGVVSFGEILLLPIVEKLLSAKGLDTSISKDDGQFIKDKVVEMGTKMNREAFEYYETSMVDAFKKCGLLPRDHVKVRRNTKGSDVPSLSLSNVLEHNCAFFRKTSASHHRPEPFSGVMANVEGICLSTFWSDEHRETYTYKVNVPDTQAIMIAKALSEKLELSGMNMEELDSLGRVFVCTRCDPLFTQKLDWQNLVVHFFRAEQDYEKARNSNIVSRDQELQSLFTNAHCLKDGTLGDCATNISSIASASEMEDMLKECSCASCSRGSRGCRRCEVCAMVGISTLKSCEKRMRVHIKREHSSTLSIKALASKLKMTKLWS